MDTIIRFFQVGGWSMVGILVCSTVALAIFLERLWTLRPSSVVPKDLIIEVDSLLGQGRMEEATLLCKKNDSSLARILSAGLEVKGKSWDEVKEAVQESGENETLFLEKFLNVLTSVVMLAPLLGFLGTISGMIDLFSAIAAQGGVENIGMLADGIYKALYTTAAGLTVAIPSLIFYKICVAKAEGLARKMEETTFRLLREIR